MDRKSPTETEVASRYPALKNQMRTTEYQETEKAGGVGPTLDRGKSPYNNETEVAN